MKLFKRISTPLIGIVFYSLAPHIVSILGLPQQYQMVFQLPALLLVFVGLWNMPKSNHRMYGNNSFMNVLFVVYSILLIIMFLRGYSLRERLPGASIIGLLSFYISDPYYLLWVFMPFVVLRMYPNYSLKGMVDIIYWACIVCGIIALLRLPQLLSYSFLAARDIAIDGSMTPFRPGRIGLEIGALFLCMRYLTQKQKTVVTISFIINILYVVLMARRGAVLMTILLLFFFLLLLYKEGTSVGRIGIVFSIAILIGLLYVTSTSSIFDYLNARGLEDSRSGVDEALLSQMSNFELWFGKGLNGKYYYLISSGIEADIYNGYRYSSETGFYNLVLKGGYVMAILYIILLLIPAYWGIFRSKNHFCRAGGFYILWSVIYLYPFGVLSFDISFFFIWMWVIMCSIPEVRNMTDSEVQTILF